MIYKLKINTLHLIITKIYLKLKKIIEKKNIIIIVTFFEMVLSYIKINMKLKCL